MDENTSLGHSNKRRNESQDRISNLPDTLLHYILSFLPALYAVRTSVLSTRWKTVWTSIHNLDFFYIWDDTVASNYTKSFFRFVDRVLQLNDVVNIEKFSLMCRDLDAPLLDKWISNMQMRKVQEVFIWVTSSSSRNMFFSRLLPWESLRILRVEMSDFRDFSIQVTTSISFPNLKILQLSGILFSCDQSTEEFSMNCSVLKDLVLENCCWSNIKTTNILAPELQVLRIKASSDNHCALKIYAESLILLKLKCRDVFKCILSNLPSLVDASIDVQTSSRINVDNVASLVRAIYNVQNLQISAESIKMFSIPDVSTHFLNFSQLNHLTVRPESESSKVSGKELIDMLSNMPTIENLFFPTGLPSFALQGRGQIIGTTRCFVSNLKLVNIQYFSWKDNEMLFLKLLMETAKPMDSWTIKLTSNPYTRRKDLIARKKKLTEQLKTFARDSNCVIEFA